MRKYQVKITGKTALLMHWDNVEWSDEMEAWKNDPASKKTSKAGDDRSPAWRWIGSTYRSADNALITMPSDNLMRCFMEGGAMVPVPGGRANKTFKSQTQSGMMVDDTDWPILVNGAPISLVEVDKLRHEEDFSKHREVARKLGFSLFIKRARVNASKHIRVRPRFDEWAVEGTLSVWDKQITHPVLQDIMTYAGNYKGLGDWRPGCKTPGPWGMFDVTVSPL